MLPTEIVSSSAKRAALTLAIIAPVCLLAASVIAGETAQSQLQWPMIVATLPLLPGLYPAAVLVNPWMDSVGDFVVTVVLGMAFNFIIYTAAIFIYQLLRGALNPQSADK